MFQRAPGNTALTPWTAYAHDLSAYAGKTVNIRWRLSSDPGGEFDGFYLDDIQVTDAGIPDPCQGHPDRPPQVTLLSPAAGSTVHGIVQLTAEASDDHELQLVQFLVDGQVVGTLQAPPFTSSWDSSGLNGNHAISARATDDLGQTTTTQPINVTAQNPTAAAVKKLSGPFRLSVTGTGFQEGCLITVGGTPAPKTTRKSDTKALALKGGALKSLVPIGSQVPVVLTNPDGGRTQPVMVGR